MANRFFPAAILLTQLLPLKTNTQLFRLIWSIASWMLMVANDVYVNRMQILGKGATSSPVNFFFTALKLFEIINIITKSLINCFKSKSLILEKAVNGC